MTALRITSMMLIAILAGSVLSIAFATSASAQAATITVATDKPAYKPGDPITVSGKVSVVQPNVLVAIMLVAPNGAIQIPQAILPNSAGAFSTVLTNYKVPKEGTYRLVASYGAIKAEIKIDIGQPAPAVKKHTDGCDLTKLVCIGVQKIHSLAEKKVCGVSQYQECAGSKWNGKFYPGDKISVSMNISPRVEKMQLKITGPNYTFVDTTLAECVDYGPPNCTIIQGPGGVVGSYVWSKEYKFPDSGAPPGMYTFQATASPPRSLPNTPSSSLVDAVGAELVGKPAKGTGVLVNMSTATVKTEVKLQSIYDSQTNIGPVISRFTMDFTPRPSQGYKLVAEKGWACTDKSGTLDCAATGSPMGPGKSATFKINRPLDSVRWTAYDASGKAIDSGTAKK